jgi:SAM-dependent methyltransferase
MTQDCVSAYGQPSFHFSLNGARSMADSYVLGDLDNEIARLEIQSAFLEPLTRRTLANAGIKEGMSCLDVGCGAGTTTQIISQMIGKKGHVIGIDVDERYLQYCRNAKQQTNAEFMLDDIWNIKVAELSDIDVPVLILHGKDDRNVYPTVSQEFFKVLSMRKTKRSKFLTAAIGSMTRYSTTRPQNTAKTTGGNLFLR